MQKFYQTTEFSLQLRNALQRFIFSIKITERKLGSYRFDCFGNESEKKSLRDETVKGANESKTYSFILRSNCLLQLV